MVTSMSRDETEHKQSGYCFKSNQILSFFMFIKHKKNTMGVKKTLME